MFIIPWSEGMTASETSRLYIRTADEQDVDRLAEYFAALSYSSRHNRFMGAVSNFSRIAFDCLVRNRKPDRFTLIAEVRHDAREAVIGEASYAVESRHRARRVRDLGLRCLAKSGTWLGAADGVAIPRRQSGIFRSVRGNIQDKRSDESAGPESRLRGRAVRRLARDQVRQAAARPAARREGTRASRAVTVVAARITNLRRSRCMPASCRELGPDFRPEPCRRPAIQQPLRRIRRVLSENLSVWAGRPASAARFRHS